MSEGIIEKKGGIANFFSRIFNNSHEKTDSVQIELDDQFSSNILSGQHSKIDETICKIAGIAIDSRIEYVGYADFDTPMNIQTYLDIISKAGLLPYGESILALLKSTEDFSFEFVTHKDFNDSYQVFCIIRMVKTSEILSIFKVTETEEQFNLLNDFLELSNIINTNGLEHFIYRHICGIILNYIKSIVSKLDIPEHGHTYIIEGWPNRCTLVNVDLWIQEEEAEG